MPAELQRLRVQGEGDPHGAAGVAGPAPRQSLAGGSAADGVLHPLGQAVEESGVGKGALGVEAHLGPRFAADKDRQGAPFGPPLEGEDGPALGLFEGTGTPALGELPDQGLGQGALPLAQGGEKVLQRAVSHGGTPS